jgi:predicted AAA+ superfamily ATPase
MWVLRADLQKSIEDGLKSRPITAILGPRQCGKTTLARAIARERQAHYFDLEDPADEARLQNPRLVLGRMRGTVVLDEIQRRPDLMPLLRVLSDRRPLPCRFLVLGSASPDLIKSSSETLAGRVRFVDMAGFNLAEVGYDKSGMLQLRGGFPDSFLANSEQESWIWREDFIRTFLERDLPQFGVQIPSTTLRRFWTMIAHYHGQLWNGSEIGASLGISHHAARRYLDLLVGGFVIRQLQPWFENVGKRVVKSPKVYIRDSGIFHSLMNLPTWAALESHPKLGASWEGFCLEQILSWAGERNASFWNTYGGAELDLLLQLGGKRWGFEFKYQDAPAMTKSMHASLAELELEHLWVIHPGDAAYPMHERVDCVPLSALPRIRRQISAE